MNGSSNGKNYDGHLERRLYGYPLEDRAANKLENDLDRRLGDSEYANRRLKNG